MVDVGGDDGAAARDLVTDEFRRDLVGDRRAKAGAVARKGRAAQILAGGDELHFLGDDALARIVKLGDVAARLGAQQLEAGTVELLHRQLFAGLEAIIFGLAGAALIFLDIAARQDPVAAALG